jgi:hypothetical protein
MSTFTEIQGAIDAAFAIHLYDHVVQVYAGTPVLQLDVQVNIVDTAI